jgi:hypothetical protein
LSSSLITILTDVCVDEDGDDDDPWEEGSDSEEGSDLEELTSETSLNGLEELIAQSVRAGGVDYQEELQAAEMLMELE